MVIKIEIPGFPIPEEGFDQLDLLVPKLLDSMFGVGMNIAIIENAKIVDVRCYGYFDKENQIPMHKDALFAWGSISKPITIQREIRNSHLTTVRFPTNHTPKFAKGSSHLTTFIH